jgi:rubrerythrin
MAETLTLEEAIQTAVEYETRVRDLYTEAVAGATEEVGKKLFNLMADEEQGHLDYLMSRFDEWERTGKIVAADLATLLPPQDVLDKGKEKLAAQVQDKDWTTELQFLQQALKLESETGAFYKKMVEELDLEGKQMFQQFLAIEDAHYDIVQAQIDALTNTGFWFDFMEFSLEAG